MKQVQVNSLATLLVGDVRECLRELADGSVHCVVTSPPYHGLRDYQTATWEGGDEHCEHTSQRNQQHGSLKGGQPASPRDSLAGVMRCRKCGARRIDRQIGLEPTITEFVQTMVEVFRDVRRVLRPDGVAFVNLGDSFFDGGRGGNPPESVHQKQQTNRGSVHGPWGDGENLKPKDLCMVPARVAIALQDAGWWLRSDIIWSKPNPMPESVTDRPTKSHEYIFMLTKAANYYWDADAVKETGKSPQMTPEEYARCLRESSEKWYQRSENPYKDGRKSDNNLMGGKCPPGGRNLRSVWTIPTQPYHNSHFATFPLEIPLRAIKAATSECGACAACGSPWRRVVEKIGSSTYEQVKQESWRQMNEHSQTRGFVPSRPLSSQTRLPNGTQPHLDACERRTLGWERTCRCETDETVPCTVLDPFCGSGTTLQAATLMGRRSIGSELNESYVEMAVRRINTKPGTPKRPADAAGQKVLF